MTDQLLVETAGAVGWVTFNNPAKHNALSVAMWRALPEALDRLEADPAIRVIVLKGAGEKAFVSGADISEFATERASEEAVAAYDELAEGATQRLRDADRPTIAMIRGYCMGGGLGLAIACDLRIAGTGATFAIPAARLGVGYRIGSLKLLTDLVGPAFAKEILITARRFSASEAERIGLVNQDRPRRHAGRDHRALLHRHCRQRAALHAREQAHDRRARTKRGRGRRPGPLRGAGDGLLHQRRLHRGAHRVHGKARAEVHGPVERRRAWAGGAG